MNVVFACAGTGGHINPAIAIANIILKNEPNSKILFLGREVGLENDLVKKAGYEIKHIRTGKILRSLTLKNVKALLNAYKGINDAKVILKEFKPDLVIGTGGYVCVPVMLACQKLKIPYILHESNALPGVSVKVLAKKAAKVFVGFDETILRLKSRNVVFTGSPAKFDEHTILKLNKESCKMELGLDNISKKIVLVICGSQGAKYVNNAVLDMLRFHLSKEFCIVLITGNGYYEDMLALKEQIERENNTSLDDYIKIYKFVYEMEKMYKVADMCIARSGAMTITELSIARIPALLIPFPYASENHQLYNAKILEKAGVARIIEEKNVTSELIYKTINDILSDKSLNNISVNALKLDSDQVEDLIYKNICDVVKK